MYGCASEFIPAGSGAGDHPQDVFGVPAWIFGGCRKALYAGGTHLALAGRFQGTEPVGIKILKSKGLI